MSNLHETVGGVERRRVNHLSLLPIQKQSAYDFGNFSLLLLSKGKKGEKIVPFEFIADF